jgi:hypothetical protein
LTTLRLPTAAPPLEGPSKFRSLHNLIPLLTKVIRCSRIPSNNSAPNLLQQAVTSRSLLLYHLSPCSALNVIRFYPCPFDEKRTVWDPVNRRSGRTIQIAVTKRDTEHLERSPSDCPSLRSMSCIMPGPGFGLANHLESMP